MIELMRMMFDWLGHSRNMPEAVVMAKSMSEATTTALANPNARTVDINGKGNTVSMAKAVLEALK
jgi:3-isopropylmalate dehydrogenase